MNYLEYLGNGGDFIIRPKWISKDKNKKFPQTGGYLKPGWMISTENFIDKLKEYSKIFKLINEENPIKNNQNSPKFSPDNIYNSIEHRLNGEIMPNYPSSEYSVFNFHSNLI